MRSHRIVNWHSWLALGSLILACLSFGCRPGPAAISLHGGPRAYTHRDYEPLLHLWTRKAQLLSVDEMDNVLTVTSTFESWDFRWAYVERYARDYRLTDARKQQFLKRSLDESKKYHQFYVALYAQHPRWGDLEEDDPTWIVRLVDSTGAETDPLEMDRIPKPSPRELTYFPYTSSFRTVYRLSFPRATEGGTPTISESADWFALRFAGAQGSADVTWQLE